MPTMTEMVNTALDKVLAEEADAMRENGLPMRPCIKQTVHTDIQAVYRIGHLAGQGRPRRWSAAIREWVIPVPIFPPGQELKVASHNLLLVVEPRWKATSVVTMEYGCEHTMETVVKRNCYEQQRCSQCGYHWGVDSGD